MKDNVKHPSHYTTGDIEVIDYIRDKLTPEEFTGYCIGNVIKYVSRWRHKGGSEDLRKAEVYLNWAIDHLTADVNYDIPETAEEFRFTLSNDEAAEFHESFERIFTGRDTTFGNFKIEIHAREDED